MSQTFPEFSNTTFPDAIQTFDKYIDITQDDVERYNAATEAMLAGNLKLAQQLINSIPNIGQKALTSNKLNTLIDTVQALEKYFSTSGFESVANSYQTNWENYINRFKYVGVWNNTTDYKMNNMVSFSSAVSGTDTTLYLYIATQDVSSGAINPYQSYQNYIDSQAYPLWYRITIKGQDGESGAGPNSVAFRYEWSDSLSYVVNDIVVYENGWWIALQPNTNSVPAVGNANWELIVNLSGNIKQYPVTSTQPSTQEVGDLWFQIVT